MKKKIDLKSMLVGITVGALLFSGIVTASTYLSGVYLNKYPIYANGNSYNPTLPLLNYQGRTYVPLSEFGTLTKSNVRFTNNTIYVESSDYNYNYNYNYNNTYNPNYNYKNNYSELDLEINETETFYVNLNKYGAQNATINYNGSDIKVSRTYISYSSPITIEGKREGNSTIIITYNTGDIEYIYVNVEDDEDYDEEIELEVGEKDTYYIDLEDYDADKATLSYDDDYIKLSKTTFYSSGKVTITAKEEGDTTIKIKYDTGDIDYIYVEITDEDSYDDEMELEVDEEDTFYIDLEDYDADKATLSYDDYYLELSKTTLTSSGKVTVKALRKGYATIRIKYDTGDIDYIDVEID